LLKLTLYDEATLEIVESNGQFNETTWDLMNGSQLAQETNATSNSTDDLPLPRRLRRGKADFSRREEVVEEEISKEFSWMITQFN